MAKLCDVVTSACVLLTFCLANTITSSLNEYYFYSNSMKDQSSEQITFAQHGDHHLSKRGIASDLEARVDAPATTTSDLTNIKPLLQPKQPSTSISMAVKSNETNVTKVTSMSDPLPPAKDLAGGKDAKDGKPPKKVNVNSNVRVEDNDDISINKFSNPTLSFNATLKENNIKDIQTDTHIYYNSSFRTDKAASTMYWVDVDSKVDMKISDLLSKSHRRAATVRLSFDFPFYGHYIRNVTIATGGFLYTGDYVHSWLAATQYIAPLMANFDTSLSNDSYIKYVDNGTSFTVLWENVSLQDKPNEGKFTFQTTLHASGDIVFVYLNVPYLIDKIEDSHHPVKVGLSDAYIIDRTIFFVRRKTIYEYHRVNFRKEDIKNGTVIYLSALPTCPLFKNCTACTTNVISFQCTWCPSLNKCSNGLDRIRQEWLMKGCNIRQIRNESECGQHYSEEALEDHEIAFNHEHSFDTHFDDKEKPSSRVQAHDTAVLPATQTVSMGVSSVLAILVVLSLVSGLIVWAFYAYRNPHTTSGQLLIRYRPSQWSWRRGEARYTAATIHM